MPEIINLSFPFVKIQFNLTIKTNSCKTLTLKSPGKLRVFLNLVTNNVFIGED